MEGSGVADASLLLSLGEASALHLLWEDPGWTWHVTHIARGEVRRDPTRSELSHAILAGRLAATELDTDSEEELRLFAHWSDVVDPGEVEAIAVALARGWVVGLEDLFAQRCVTRQAGEAHWVNAAGLLLRATHAGRMSIADADAVFVRLDCYSGYRKRGISSLRNLSP
jgi:uncharacterized protein (DUF849 family)